MLLLACVLGSSLLSAEVNSVFISSRLDPNAIIITGVDVVFVYDQEIVDSFPATKTQWYSGKRRFTQEMGDGADVVSVSIPQGFDSTMVSLPQRRSEALKVFVIGQHDDALVAPMDVTGFGNVLVEIDPFGIIVSRRN